MALDNSKTSFPTEWEEYIKNRIEQYKGWYDKKAVSMKTLYLRMKAVIVIGGALVPILVNIPLPYINIAATIVSALVLGLIALDSVFHYGEQWRNYRSTEQFLGQEVIFFKHRIGPYSDLDESTAFRTLVKRVEEAIEQENAVTLDVLTRSSNNEKEYLTSITAESSRMRQTTIIDKNMS
ncbi:MAG: DUF4231 domain-containing protein [Ktedonobacteraceae bacterium]|nr:DUF4231 domain-containing protein [Ktedonobacteraceae bacterium]